MENKWRGVLRLPVVRPEAILAFQEVPRSGDGALRRADDVPDLDGKPAHPSMYVYSSPSRWRAADLYFLSGEERQRILQAHGGGDSWLVHLLRSVGHSSAKLHAVGGHDHSLSAHNVFLDGTRVDFEYTLTGERPHPTRELNGDPEIWRAKELDGLRNMAWELAELVCSELPPDQVSQCWRVAFDQGPEGPE